MKSTELSRASGAGQVTWTRDLARDLFGDLTTPFAWTLLRSPAEAALRGAYIELGAPATAAGEPFWRSDGCTVYLNAALVALADQALAGAAWLGRGRPAGPGGFLARLQTGGIVKRCQARLAAVPDDARGLQARLLAWLTRVQGLNWTQADLLQVMEELEPHALAALQIYFLARMGLNTAHAQLQTRLAEWAPDCPSEVLACLYLGVEDLPSVAMAEAVVEAARDPARRAGAALARWSHRGPGEMRPDARRWGSAPLEMLDFLARQDAGGWRREDAAERRKAALADIRPRLDGARFRQIEELLSQVHVMMVAADVGWDALAIVIAAAQLWTVAAAREALAAGLISRTGDVLYLELEELKQVATGEWHAGRSAGVQESVAARMRALASPAAPPGEAGPTVVSPGACEGPLYGDSPARNLPPPQAVWLAESADPGCTPFWRYACAVLTTGDEFWAPGMIAARGLGAPARVGVAAGVVK